MDNALFISVILDVMTSSISCSIVARISIVASTGTLMNSNTKTAQNKARVRARRGWGPIRCFCLVARVTQVRGQAATGRGGFRTLISFCLLR